ncbi:MAG: ATP-binding protein [Thermoprotei archaeon]
MSLRVFISDSELVYAAPTQGELPHLGELFVLRDDEGSVLLKVVGHGYVSTIRSEILAMMSREWDTAEPVQLTYNGSPTTFVAKLKPLIERVAGALRPVRRAIPPGAELVRASVSDLGFIQNSSGLFLGNVRSGYNVLSVELRLDPLKVVSEHVLVAASTGRGKSNLLKVLLWSLLDHPKLGVFVVDPHREYYSALIDHPRAQENLVCFSPNPKEGEVKLAISTRLIRPYHLSGVINLSDAQEREAYLLYKEFKEDWVERLLTADSFMGGLGDDDLDHGARVARATLSRKLMRLLSVGYEAGGGVFKLPKSVKEGEVDGSEFLNGVFEELEARRVVVVDTSNLSEEAELLLGNMVAYMILDRHMHMKQENKEITPVGIVLEEAPRVLGIDAPENGYMKLAREGRKFGIGLVAVTQLISVIPEEILANMNTKIYLGMASGKERRAAIDNALHDLSEEEDELLRLDVGEAIVTSTSLGFPVPIKIPFIDKLKNDLKTSDTVRRVRPGEKLI